MWDQNFGWGHKDILSLENKLKGGSAIRAPISPMPCTEVMATKKAVFIDRCNSEHIANGSKHCFMQWLRTKLGSQSGVGILICVKRVMSPFRDLAVVEWGITKKSSIGIWKGVIATKWTLMELLKGLNFSIPMGNPRLRKDMTGQEKDGSGYTKGYIFSISEGKYV